MLQYTRKSRSSSAAHGPNFPAFSFTVQLQVRSTFHALRIPHRVCDRLIICPDGRGTPHLGISTLLLTLLSFDGFPLGSSLRRGRLAGGWLVGNASSISGGEAAFRRRWLGQGGNGPDAAVAWSAHHARDAAEHARNQNDKKQREG